MPKTNGHWKPGDPINRKRFINFSFFVNPTEKAMIKVLADAQNMAQAQMMQGLLHDAYKAHLAKEGREIPPTLLNCADAMNKLTEEFAVTIRRLDWIRKLLALSAEYRHEVLAERLRITDEMMSDIKDVRLTKFKKKAKRVGETLPEPED